MPAVDAAGGATALEIKAGSETRCYCSRFEKGDGQEGNLPILRDLCNIFFERITEAAIDAAVLILKAEDFERQVVEILPAGSKNPVGEVIIFNGVFQYLSLNLRYNTQRCDILY